MNTSYLENTDWKRILVTALRLFDYQIVEDVNLVTEMLNNGSLNRSRPWYS